ncbi:MAG TPA: FadR/GntR family transcriptional regulator [Burkholderiaceae bacterium]|nr:FadR/GntR family transcriptional regulator [Burkholderiaceae bacterium]
MRSAQPRTHAQLTSPHVIRARARPDARLLDGRTRAIAKSARVIARYRGARLHVAVTREIGSRILSGEFAPGEVLPNEAEWSRQFCVSRSAVRESIKVLGGKGLLISRPRVGTTVEPRERWNLLDRDVLVWYSAMRAKGDFLRAVQEMRRIIEPEAAALAASKRTALQMTAISTACAEMGSAPTLVRRIDADVRFHRAILAAAGNEFLIPFGFLIESALGALFEVTTRDHDDLAHAQDLHQRIEEAIRRSQPQRARLAVRRLLGSTDDFIVRKARPAGRKRAG